MHRIVFTLSMRITSSSDLAEEVTVDVFHDVWRRASTYDANGGPVVGWIMNQARSRAIDRLRYERRKKRDSRQAEGPLPVPPVREPDAELRMKEQSRLLREALKILTEAERYVIEAAFFSELPYPEVAARLNEPLGTIKTRIRSGLQKLRSMLLGEEAKP
jgi:RNA polymerase sigma-70 factor (ECF subfamily)